MAGVLAKRARENSLFDVVEIFLVLGVSLSSLSVQAYPMRHSHVCRFLGQVVGSILYGLELPFHGWFVLGCDCCDFGGGVLFGWTGQM